MNAPPIGWRVQYYPNGDTKHPHVADVVSRGMNGQVKVNYQTVGARELQTSRMYIHHISDPWAKLHPEHIQKHGCWDYVPGMEYADPNPPESDRHAEGLAKAKEHMEKGLDIDEISKKVRTYGVSRQEVEDLLTQPV